MRYKHHIVNWIIKIFLTNNYRNICSFPWGQDLQWNKNTPNTNCGKKDKLSFAYSPQKHNTNSQHRPFHIRKIFSVTESNFCVILVDIYAVLYGWKLILKNKNKKHKVKQFTRLKRLKRTKNVLLRLIRKRCNFIFYDKNICSGGRFFLYNVFYLI